LKGKETKPLYKLSNDKIKIIKQEIELVMKMEQILFYYPKILLQNIKELLNLKSQEEEAFNSASHIIDTFYHSADVMVLLNKALINVLTSFRGYLDSVEHMLSNRFGKDNTIIKTFKEKQTELFDKHFEYRFLYRFRNYVQHVGFPISDISADNIEQYKTGKIRSKVTMRKAMLLEYDGWGPVLKDLEKMEDNIDIIEIVRNFEIIIQELNITLVSASLKSGLFDYSNTKRLYENCKNDNKEMSVAILFNSNSQYRFQVFPEKMLDILREIQEI